jgi:hypothetical protein
LFYIICYDKYSAYLGCSITNPEIYIGKLLPSSDQEVFFNVTEVNAYLFAPSNSTFNVSSLYAWNTRVVIEPNASIIVAQELEFYQVHLHVNETGGLIVHEGASFEGMTLMGGV